MPAETLQDTWSTSHDVRKRTFGHMRPTKTQISLRIRAVWSESSLPAWRNFASSLSKMHPWKILVTLYDCASWSESSLGAHVRRYLFWHRGLIHHPETNNYLLEHSWILPNMVYVLGVFIKPFAMNYSMTRSKGSAISFHGFHLLLSSANDCLNCVDSDESLNWLCTVFNVLVEGH